MKKQGWHLPELTTKAKIGAGLLLAAVIAVIVIFVVTTSIIRQLSGEQGAVDQNFAAKDTVTRQKDAKTSAADAITGGNDKKAADIYRQAIEAEGDGTKKVQLAIDHSRMLSYEGKFDEAIEVAKQAEAYSDDKYLITDWLARLYASAKRYSDAAANYTKAGGLVNSPTNEGGYTKQYYENKAAAMKALAEKK